MSGRPDSDVERALASFGGLSMKYHSFGPAPVRPASPGQHTYGYEGEGGETMQPGVAPAPYFQDPNERAARVFPLLGRAMPEAEEVTVPPDIAPPAADEPPPRQASREAWGEPIEATEEPDSLAPLDAQEEPYAEAEAVEPTEATPPETLVGAPFDDDTALPPDTDAVLASPHAHFVETPLYESAPPAGAGDAEESEEYEESFFAEAAPPPAARPDEREAGPIFAEPPMPYDASAEPIAPESFVPEYDAAEHQVPEHQVPEHQFPEHGASEYGAPERYAPEHYAPEHYAPEHPAPEHYAPERRTAEDEAPVPMAPEPLEAEAWPEPAGEAESFEPPAALPSAGTVREAPPPQRAGVTTPRTTGKPLADVFRVLKENDAAHPPPTRPQKSDLRDMFRRL